MLQEPNVPVVDLQTCGLSEETDLVVAVTASWFHKGN
jgi:hypothetical protein